MNKGLIVGILVIWLIILAIGAALLLSNRGETTIWFELELKDYCRVRHISDDCAGWAIRVLDNAPTRDAVQTCVNTQEHYSGGMRRCLDQIELPEGF